MEWALVEPPSKADFGEYVLEEWRSGSYALTILQYALGQRRVRLWGKETHWCYPESVAPEA